MSVSVLYTWYVELRAAGLGHEQAIAVLAERLDVDPQTVRRSLRRAERDACE